jgi:hypothetical protein
MPAFAGTAHRQTEKAFPDPVIIYHKCNSGIYSTLHDPATILRLRYLNLIQENRMVMNM